MSISMKILLIVVKIVYVEDGKVVEKTSTYKLVRLQIETLRNLSPIGAYEDHGLETREIRGSRQCLR